MEAAMNTEQPPIKAAVFMDGPQTVFCIEHATKELRRDIVRVLAMHGADCSLAAPSAMKDDPKPIDELEGTRPIVIAAQDPQSPVQWQPVSAQPEPVPAQPEPVPMQQPAQPQPPQDPERVARLRQMIADKDRIKAEKQQAEAETRALFRQIMKDCEAGSTDHIEEYWDKCASGEIKDVGCRQLVFFYYKMKFATLIWNVLARGREVADVMAIYRRMIPKKHMDEYKTWAAAHSLAESDKGLACFLRFKYRAELQAEIDRRNRSASEWLTRLARERRAFTARYGESAKAQEEVDRLVLPVSDKHLAAYDCSDRGWCEAFGIYGFNICEHEIRDRLDEILPEWKILTAEYGDRIHEPHSSL